MSLGHWPGHDDIGGTERLGGIRIYLGGAKNPEETMRLLGSVLYESSNRSSSGYWVVYESLNHSSPGYWVVYFMNH